jgi:hypothetical protein
MAKTKFLKPPSHAAVAGEGGETAWEITAITLLTFVSGGSHDY